MPKWSEKIDGNHLKIASHSGKPMRVLAGPGTGKSYALQRKAMRLLEEGCDPHRILVVTFTNVAADSLKKDMQDMGLEGSDLIQARTLHSLCFQILSQEEIFKVTDRNARPLMAFEEDLLLEDIKEEFGGKREAKDLLIAYESAFARQQEDIPGAISTTIDREFKKRIIEWLKSHQAILIGELIPIAHQYLSTNPTAKELSDFDYVLVDEYQDLNKVEQSLIDLLATNAELVVIGDEDQSIYSFKHAHPDGITQLPEKYTTIEDVTLQICRRCPKKVVALANELMGYEFEKTHKKLEPFETNDEGEVYNVQWENVEKETEGVAKVIKNLIENQGNDIKAEDILILSPRRKLGYFLRDELKKYKIQTHTFFQEDALDDKTAKSAYSLMNYIAYPEDRVALRAVLGIESPLETTYKKILNKATELGTTPKDIITKIISGTITIPRITTAHPIIIRFLIAEKARTDLEGKTVNEVLEYILDPGLVADMEVFVNLIETVTITEGMTIQSFFDKVQGRIISPEVTQEEGYVRIMSLHKSKGLTAKAVIILGCVSGLIPFIKNKDDLLETGNTPEIERQHEENRRLFFVAITRAKKYLMFSSFRDIDFAMAMQLTVDLRLSGRRSSMPQTTSTSFFGDMPTNLPQAQTGESFLTSQSIV